MILWMGRNTGEESGDPELILDVFPGKCIRSGNRGAG